LEAAEAGARREAEAGAGAGAAERRAKSQVGQDRPPAVARLARPDKGMTPNDEAKRRAVGPSVLATSCAAVAGV
jgi:hypothetical protein